MEWWAILPLIFITLLGLMLLGLPVAFAFMAINIVGAYLLWGGTAGYRQLIFSIFQSVTFFALLPVPLFILMGEVLFRSGMGSRMVDALDRMLGRLPGRLSLVAVAGGVLMGVLSGNSYASTAMLGSLLGPDMEKKGYKKPMTLGPIMGSGVLAIIIPPSGLSVVLATLAGVSVGGLLIAGLVPGIVMAVLAAIYIIVRCMVQPDIAPTYSLGKLGLKDRLLPAVKYVLPLGVVVFCVIGLMMLGWATPSESAAFGTIATIVLAAMYRQLNFRVIKEAFAATLTTTIMIFIIFCGSAAFSQILAYSGASKGLVDFAVGANVPPFALLSCIMILLLFLGMFMEQLSIMMITLPIFMPICRALHWDPIWFCLMMLINMGIANLSPPFGMQLFVMKAVSPADTTMGDIYRAAIPFVLLYVAVIFIVMFFPRLATWLPALM